MNGLMLTYITYALAMHDSDNIDLQERTAEIQFARSLFVQNIEAQKI